MVSRVFSWPVFRCVSFIFSTFHGQRVVEDSQPFPLASHCTVGPESRAAGEHRCKPSRDGGLSCLGWDPPGRATRGRPCHSARDLSGNHVPVARVENEGPKLLLNTYITCSLWSVFSPWAIQKQKTEQPLRQPPPPAALWYLSFSVNCFSLLFLGRDFS